MEKEIERIINKINTKISSKRHVYFMTELYELFCDLSNLLIEHKKSSSSVEINFYDKVIILEKGDYQEIIQINIPIKLNFTKCSLKIEVWPFNKIKFMNIEESSIVGGFNIKDCIFEILKINLNSDHSALPIHNLSLEKIETTKLLHLEINAKIIDKLSITETVFSGQSEIKLINVKKIIFNNSSVSQIKKMYLSNCESIEIDKLNIEEGTLEIDSGYFKELKLIELKVSELTLKNLINITDLQISNCEIKDFIFAAENKNSLVIKNSIINLNNKTDLSLSFNEIEIDNSQFSNVIFNVKELSIQNSNFSKIIFKEGTSVHNIKICNLNKKEKNQNTCELIAKNLKDVRQLEFAHAKLGHCNFDSTIFEGYTSFQDVEFNNAPSFFASKFYSNTQFLSSKFKDFSNESIHKYRHLKNEMGKFNNLHDENYFAGLEMKARGKNLSLYYDFFEKLCSIAAWVLNDYGISLFRPFCWLISIWIFGTWYFEFDVNFTLSQINKIEPVWHKEVRQSPIIFKSMFFSLINALGPVRIFIDEPIFVSKNISTQIIVFLINILSSVLWYLGITGIKKRFRQN